MNRGWFVYICKCGKAFEKAAKDYFKTELEVCINQNCGRVLSPFNGYHDPNLEIDETGELLILKSKSVRGADWEKIKLMKR